MSDPDHRERATQAKQAAQIEHRITIAPDGDSLTLTAHATGTYARSAPPIILAPTLARMDKAAKALLGAKVQRRKVSDSEYVYRRPQASDWVQM